MKPSRAVLDGELRRGIGGECVNQKCPLWETCSRQIVVSRVDWIIPQARYSIVGRGSMKPIKWPI